MLVVQTAALNVYMWLSKYSTTTLTRVVPTAQNRSVDGERCAAGLTTKVMETIVSMLVSRFHHHQPARDNALLHCISALCQAMT